MSDTGGGFELRVPHNRVSPKAKLYWACRAAFSWVFVFGAQVVWLLVDDEGAATPHVVVAVVSAALAVAHVVVMPRWRFAVHRWEITPDAVYTRSGWLDQEWRIAPVSRIQTVDSERGVLERMFGLANLTVTTASSAGPIKIHGLDHETAQRAAEELTGNAVASEGDAT
ncbi:PH domain-containing protein [Amycolatopsis sp. cg5]|uniref:PH domain-containing protein n=1 Tax=Amycolatopsis sp. cg5 TaxID=3238802 RepID=UPI0035234309